jgi:phage terminase small subunit
MEGYEYVMEEKRAKQLFGPDTTGRAMQALISNVDEENQGVSFRAITEFFTQLDKLKPEHRSEFKFFGSMYQIYNEAVYDLLNDGSTGDGDDAFQAPVG